jgi:hypothetical protein
MLVFSGCGGGDGDPTDNPPPVGDNVRFYGTFAGSVNWAGVSTPWDGAITLGGDLAQSRPEAYWYVPPSGNSANFTEVGLDGWVYEVVVTISGNSIKRLATVSGSGTQSGLDWTEATLTFSGDGNSFTYTVVHENAAAGRGTGRGTFTRQ